MMKARPKILVLEDSTFFSNLVSKRLKEELNARVTVVKTLQESMKALDKDDDYYVCILDLTIPDAQGAEIVQAFIDRKQKCVAFTGNFDQSLRDEIFKIGAIDYVLKESPASVDYLVATIRRLWRNQNITALIVEDAPPLQMLLKHVMEQFCFKTVLAANGAEAIEVFKKHGDIKLVLTDYQMPEMDGFQLIKALRRTHSKERLVIIGLSGVEDKSIPAQLIKMGANDFVSKPFVHEELLCRVFNNIDNLEHVEKLYTAATRDYLTGLYNRRFFFDAAHPMFSDNLRTKHGSAMIMSDIDHFKSVNDTHGHNVGDQVLQHVSKMLMERCRESDILARFGGEEFGIYLSKTDPDFLSQFCKDLLSKIANTPIETDAGPLNITISLGVTSKPADTLEDMILAADEQLYAAKESGRNRAVIHTDLDERISVTPEGDFKKAPSGKVKV